MEKFEKKRWVKRKKTFVKDKPMSRLYSVGWHVAINCDGFAQFKWF